MYNIFIQINELLPRITRKIIFSITEKYLFLSLPNLSEYLLYINNYLEITSQYNIKIDDV